MKGDRFIMETFYVSDFINSCEKNCSKIQRKHFKKNEIITTFISKRNQVCILASGEAELVRYDYNGNKTIVEHFNKNDIFGEVFYTITTNNELFVVAKQNCDVMFFVYDNLKQKCKPNCKFHQVFNENFSELILQKVTVLNSRIELLTKRSTRDKLIGYFTLLSNRNFSKSFSLPFSLTDLADYLSVDRSAMMRELKSLRDEGFIEKDGDRITLLYK